MVRMKSKKDYQTDPLRTLSDRRSISSKFIVLSKIWVFTRIVHHDERGKKASHLEVPAYLLCAPGLTMLRFEEFTTAGLSIDFG
jgi:hypothetical protein